jgi:hypothetical protein
MGAVIAALGGADAADFVITANDCTALHTNAVCEVQVAFRPVAAGMSTAQLVVSTAVGGTVVANLSGTATP